MPLDCRCCHCLFATPIDCIGTCDLSDSELYFYDFMNINFIIVSILLCVSQPVASNIVVLNIVVAILLPGGLFCTVNDWRK